MAKYIFILGHNPALSALEIIKTIQAFSGKFKILFGNFQALVVETKNIIDSNDYLYKLGGTIKIGILDGPILNLPKDNDNLQEIQKYIINELTKLPRQEKVKYGFSIFTEGQQKFWQKKFNWLGLETKRRLVLRGRKARYIVSQEPSLSSVIVQKEKLDRLGRDFLFFIHGKTLYTGRTEVVQNFFEYGKRDFGRPARDSFSGMLPVKLAKILINISGALPDEPILDPFCGSGTIITEALNMGFKKISGTDISQKAIANTQNNINWVVKKFNLNKNNYQIFLDKIAVGDLPKVFAAGSFQAVITEPYLGDPHKSRADFGFRIAEMKKIEDLYFQTFNIFYQLLKPQGRVVIIWPAYSIFGAQMDNYHPHKPQFLNLSDNLLKKIIGLGFSQEVLDHSLIPIDNIEKLITKRGSIMYFRPNQRVQREIFIFKKEANN